MSGSLFKFLSVLNLLNIFVQNQNKQSYRKKCRVAITKKIEGTVFLFSSQFGDLKFLSKKRERTYCLAKDAKASKLCCDIKRIQERDDDNSNSFPWDLPRKSLSEMELFSLPSQLFGQNIGQKLRFLHANPVSRPLLSGK